MVQVILCRDGDRSLSHLYATDNEQHQARKGRQQKRELVAGQQIGSRQGHANEKREGTGGHGHADEKRLFRTRQEKCDGREANHV